MPFPRRITIYLREKGIPSSLIQIVPVSDPQLGNSAPPGFPPRPAGSLPILVIPSPNHAEGHIYIRQSIAIINYIDEFCDAGKDGFPKSMYSMRGTDSLSRARQSELMSLAEECTIGWNPVRTFGSDAGTISIPAASREMIRWVHRPLVTIEGWFKDRDFSDLKKGGSRGPMIAEIVLYQFLEFTKDCYGVDMTHGSEEKVIDGYGREVIQKYEKLSEFYEAFKTRDSAFRDETAGEVPSKDTLKVMMNWAEGSL
jgi:glutathione S-transferase